MTQGMEQGCRRTAGQLVLLATLLLAATASRAEDVRESDRFQLWNGCLPTVLLVEDLHTDAADIGLSKVDVETSVRSRLRAARLYVDGADYEASAFTYFYVNVGVVGQAYGMDIQYVKYLYDSTSDTFHSAITWDRGSIGTHGGDANFILGGLARLVDQFIDEYLRVNADAC